MENIKQFKNKDRYLESDRVWTLYLQYRDGYIYATNYYILARIKGERPEIFNGIEKVTPFEKLFETTNLIGTVERKEVNRLLPMEDELDYKLKLYNNFFQKKYLKKMFKAGGKEAKVYETKTRYMYVFKFEEIEFSIMGMANDQVEMESKEIPIIKPEEKNG